MNQQQYALKNINGIKKEIDAKAKEREMHLQKCRDIIQEITELKKELSVQWSIYNKR